MGDATKLAFAVFLISCSSGGCGGGYAWLVVSWGELREVQCLLLPLQNAMHSLMMCVDNAMQCNPVERGGSESHSASLVLPCLCILHPLFVDVHCACCSCEKWAQDGAWGPQQALEWLLVGHTGTNCFFSFTMSIKKALLSSIVTLQPSV